MSPSGPAFICNAGHLKACFFSADKHEGMRAFLQKAAAEIHRRLSSFALKPLRNGGFSAPIAIRAKIQDIALRAANAAIASQDGTFSSAVCHPSLGCL